MHLTPAHPEVLTDEYATLPAHYFSCTPAATKFRAARDVARAVETTYGYTVLAASVTGSKLRGMDNGASDTGVMVIVAETPRQKRHKSLIINTPGAGHVDTALHSLSEFTVKLSGAVPMLECLFSPFLLVHPHYAAYFAHLRPGIAHMHTAARRYVGHLVNRPANAAKPSKTARNAVATLYNIDCLRHALTCSTDNQHSAGNQYNPLYSTEPLPLYHAVCTPRVFAMFAGQDRVNYAEILSNAGPYVTSNAGASPRGTFGPDDTVHLRHVYDRYIAEVELLKTKEEAR